MPKETVAERRATFISRMRWYVDAGKLADERMRERAAATSMFNAIEYHESDLHEIFRGLLAKDFLDDLTDMLPEGTEGDLETTQSEAIDAHFETGLLVWIEKLEELLLEASPNPSNGLLRLGLEYIRHTGWRRFLDRLRDA